jgi:hypothetical protein
MTSTIRGTNRKMPQYLIPKDGLKEIPTGFFQSVAKSSLTSNNSNTNSELTAHLRILYPQHQDSPTGFTFRLHIGRYPSLFICCLNKPRRTSPSFTAIQGSPGANQSISAIGPIGYIPTGPHASIHHAYSQACLPERLHRASFYQGRAEKRLASEAGLPDGCLHSRWDGQIRSSPALE